MTNKNSKTGKIAIASCCSTTNKIGETLLKVETQKKILNRAKRKQFEKFDKKAKELFTSDKEISSIIFYGMNELGSTGGLTGDIEVIMEALVNGMLRDPQLFAIFKTIVTITEQESKRRELEAPERIQATDKPILKISQK